jgi:hypothetical protein
MTEEKKVPVMVIGVWKLLRPDNRQYRQQSIEIEMNQRVAVDVPNDPKYVVSLSEGIITLTPDGMKYVQEQFEKLYMDIADTIEGFEAPTPARKELVNDLDGWSETDTEVKKEVAKVVASDDGWGEDPVFDDTPATNTPETEVWDEKEEDWK